MLSKYIAHNKEMIDHALKEHFDNTEAQLSGDRVVLDLVESIKSVAMNGGKRLRPLLMSLSYEMYGGGNKLLKVQAGIVLELLHTFMLIHDDIEDGDLQRHGGPTVEAIYRNKLTGKNIEQRNHIARGCAINAGDVAHSMVYAKLSSLSAQPSTIVSLVKLVSDKSIITALGQQHDILAPTTKKLVLADVERIALYKTAYYSFILPLLFGSTLAENTKDGKKLEQIGRNLGVAFQITDDLLGVYGQSEVLGKPNISDMREGKNTMLLHHALSMAQPSQIKTIKKYWGNSQADSAALDQIREIFEVSGAKQKAINDASELHAIAVKNIKGLKIDTKYQQLLQEFSDKCVNRIF